MIKKCLLFLLFLVTCSVYAANWSVNEADYEGGYKYYTITETPEKYKYLKNVTVFTFVDNGRYQNLFSTPCKDRVLDYLEKEDFQIFEVDNISCPFFPISFTQYNFNISKDQLSYIWNLFSKNYAGFSAMKKRGLKEKYFLKIKEADKLFKTLDKYVDDGHFWIQINDRLFRKEQVFDENTSQSIDPWDTYFEIETSNAYYVRFCNCTSETYLNDFQKVAEKVLNKDFLILDARTNSGGNDMPQRNLRDTLMRNKYKGTVIILQDNWSYSSGELWHVFGAKGVRLNCKLVGTHSGGMQNYGNCETYQDRNLKVQAYFGYTDFTGGLPENYLGDGKGYEPDLWATKEIMKIVLEDGYGVDLTGINFQ